MSDFPESPRQKIFKVRTILGIVICPLIGIVLFLITCSINVASDLIVKGVKKANKT